MSYEIGEPIEEIPGMAEGRKGVWGRWTPIREQVDQMEEGLWLPVTLEITQELERLQTSVGSWSWRNKNGRFYRSRRDGLTLFITWEKGGAA